MITHFIISHGNYSFPEPSDAYIESPLLQDPDLRKNENANSSRDTIEISENEIDIEERQSTNIMINDLSQISDFDQLGRIVVPDYSFLTGSNKELELLSEEVKILKNPVQANMSETIPNEFEKESRLEDASCKKIFAAVPPSCIVEKVEIESQMAEGEEAYNVNALKEVDKVDDVGLCVPNLGSKACNLL